MNLKLHLYIARDIYHNNVKYALIKDNWIISHNPLTLKFGKKDLYIHLGARQLLAAQKAEYKIAVKIKSFIGRSDTDQYQPAWSQIDFCQNTWCRLDWCGLDWR